MLSGLTGKWICFSVISWMIQAIYHCNPGGPTARFNAITNLESGCWCNMNFWLKLGENCLISNTLVSPPPLALVIFYISLLFFRMTLHLFIQSRDFLSTFTENIIDMNRSLLTFVHDPFSVLSHDWAHFLVLLCSDIKTCSFYFCQRWTAL